jgi:hypothetical protein
VFDIHTYEDVPHTPAFHAKRAIVLGEYGGVGYPITGHLWREGQTWSYQVAKTPEDYLARYRRKMEEVVRQAKENGLSASVYTQTSDVEGEINGLLTYDRVPKMDVAMIAKANRFEVPPPVYTVVAPTSEKESQTWRYTTGNPAPGWFRKDFNDADWQQGPGGFGTAGTPGIGRLGTTWNTSNIWLRRVFHPGALTAEQVDRLLIRDYHDEDVQVFINGVRAYKADGFHAGYENRPLSEAARKALLPGADNVIAVHCKQTVGGQYIDVGLTIREPAVK